MTTFQNGPAVTGILYLKRTPIFLRIVMDQNDKIDALDQPDDDPKAGEVLFAYQLTKRPAFAAIRRIVGGGGIYPQAEYQLCPIQPTQEQMRTRTTWHRWCEAQALPEFLRKKGL